MTVKFTLFYILIFLSIDISAQSTSYFIFQNLKEETSYLVYYEDTTDNIVHNAFAITNAPIDTLHLITNLSQNKQNGFHLTIAGSNSGVLSGANTCAFNSPFAIGFLNNGFDGSNYKLSSDASVHSFKFSITSGSYFLNRSLDVGGIPLFSKDAIQVEKKTTFDTIKLKYPNGIQFTIFDSLGTRVSRASICVFTSLALYQQDTCAGRNFSLLSDINGVTAKYAVALYLQHLHRREFYMGGKRYSSGNG